MEKKYDACLNEIEIGDIVRVFDSKNFFGIILNFDVDCGFLSVKTLWVAGLPEHFINTVDSKILKKYELT